MTEFIFLPDRGSKPGTSFQTLATAVSGIAKLTYSPRAESVTESGFSGAIVATASNIAEVSALAAREDAPEIEIVDYIQQTGVVLLRAESPLEDNPFDTGTIVPVHLYRLAVAEVRVGRSKLKLNSGPAATDFLKLSLRFSDDNSPVVGAVANLRQVGEEELSAVSDTNGFVTFALHASRKIRESPRLRRGGTQSLTYTGVHRETPSCEPPSNTRYGETRWTNPRR